MTFYIYLGYLDLFVFGRGIFDWIRAYVESLHCIASIHGLQACKSALLHAYQVE